MFTETESEHSGMSNSASTNFLTAGGADKIIWSLNSPHTFDRASHGDLLLGSRSPQTSRSVKNLEVISTKTVQSGRLQRLDKLVKSRGIVKSKNHLGWEDVKDRPQSSTKTVDSAGGEAILEKKAFKYHLRKSQSKFCSRNQFSASKSYDSKPMKLLQRKAETSLKKAAPFAAKWSKPQLYDPTHSYKSEHSCSIG